MKAISATLLIIVSAIVILITALVVLTIFGTGIQPVVDLASKQNLCISEYSTLCVAGAIKGNEKPPTWNTQIKINTGGGKSRMESCASLVDCTDCTDKIATCKVK